MQEGAIGSCRRGDQTGYSQDDETVQLGGVLFHLAQILTQVPDGVLRGFTFAFFARLWCIEQDLYGCACAACPLRDAPDSARRVPREMR